MADDKPTSGVIRQLVHCEQRRAERARKRHSDHSRRWRRLSNTLSK